MKRLDDNKIIEILKTFNRCRLHCKEEDFRRFVLEGYHSAKCLELNSYGNEYQGQVVYQINEFGRSVGFFAEFLYVLKRLYFAADRGFVPYVEWGGHFLYYEDDEVDGEHNAFLYYFEPVSDVIHANHAAHVLMAEEYHIASVEAFFYSAGYTVTNEYMDALSSMAKKYIRYNKKTMEYLQNGYDMLIGNRKALAVHFRGTDYRRQYNNHPVFVTIEQEIAKVHEIFEAKDYEVIFLATDEQEAVDIFQREFGDFVKVFDDTWRADGEDESVAFSHAEREHHHYLLGLEVIRDQYMLTRCEGLICGISNLTLSARIMRKAWYDKDYDDLIILDNGLCNNERRFCDAVH